MKQFAVYPEFTEEEARHFLLPRKDVVGSYVVEDPQTHHITDFISFFHIQSTVMNNPKYNSFSATYCYYYAAMKTDLKVLMENALVAAKSEGGDVFNALEVMNNAQTFENLKFARGDGTLHYYFYNWKLNSIEPSAMGVVLPSFVCSKSSSYGSQEVEREVRKTLYSMAIKLYVEKAPSPKTNTLINPTTKLSR